MSSETKAPKVPIARVKRIIKQDDDIAGVSSSALFAQYFTEQALLSAQGERRKKLQYADFANAVANNDQLEFLSDLVPKKVPFRKVLEHRQQPSDKQGIRKFFSPDGEKPGLAGEEGAQTETKPDSQEDNENKMDVDTNNDENETRDTGTENNPISLDDDGNATTAST
ncbi:hypothetical protein TRICI_001913 [Trichomonascus ciferrii]|uniref:Transcription factor CBF/NF-Y/archaeal histone domain-containing protein n=1 Tax=Trichomonascus ciferrii TaxID=44093 RepID=A0A642V860_9ASCO|nr:hypothetical protein TRICI_001913 [Trichomonascus ciferrii]